MSEPEIHEDQLAAYLVEHPDFFERHPDLLAGLRFPPAHGNRAISLHERQLEVLRDKLRHTERKLGELVHLGKENDAIAERLQRWTRELLLTEDDDRLPGAVVDGMRNGFSVPFTYNSKNTFDVLSHPRWMLGVLARYIANGGMPQRVNFPDELKGSITTAYGGNKETRSDSLSWDDLKALRDIWPHKLLVKGLLHPDDAAK